MSTYPSGFGACPVANVCLVFFFAASIVALLKVSIIIAVSFWRMLKLL